jgi:maleylpyruvate isomerase
MKVDSEQKLVWYRHWIVIGFEALETLLDKTQYCFGEQPTLADVYLIPQVYNALRFEVDMTSFPKIMNAYQNCNQLDAFMTAKPENQQDAV